MDRTAMLRRLAAERFDLLVVGGGITGAGVAREAALRGLRVGLVEAHDFASGTSSRSSKLIHGGLRYLQQFEFRLVHEAVVERQLLQGMAPQICRPLPFLFPIYPWDPDGRLKLGAGLMLYDMFAARHGGQRHRALPAPAVVAQEPALGSQGLRGGFLYYDGTTNDARLTLAVARDAASRGAAVANYTRLTRVHRPGGGPVTGVAVQDRQTGNHFDISAAKVLAAAGPWADAIRRLEDPQALPIVRMTKGIHLTLPAARLPITQAVDLRGLDGRLMFAIPAGDYAYIGSTDTDYQGDPAAAVANRREVDYILAAANRTFPAAALTHADVVSTWAGVRPLLGAVGNPSKLSRDYRLFIGSGGMITVAGGKLTAFRAMAAHIIDQVFPQTRGGEAMRRSREALAFATAEPAATAEPTASVLSRRLAAARAAVRDEMASHLDDLLTRRTNVQLFSQDRGLDGLDDVAAAMAELLGWTAEQQAQEVAGYRQLVSASMAWRE